ncbi:DUF6701 domain-containing protein [Tolumonas lignilytica]|uniref:DUF6701 domain-containing protein n=1 Tax=Tolumonas lignilytica TaxID=1283284 RepID=UPI0004AC7207|nr:DUF6701 domain-containing protein [Tolumonas lignilytica]
MAKLIRFTLTLFCCLASLWVRADVVLVGSMNIGDNSTNAINPTTLVGQSNNAYIPGAHPIHFTLSQSGTVTQLKVNNLSGYLHGVNFVVWNSSGQVVISQTASDSQPNLISGSWSLAAGDYRMAVWGQCIKESNYAIISYSSCLNPNGQQEWDDISFTNITLTGISSSSVNFIQRLHLGDSTDATRWYPPSPSANVSVSDTTSGAAITSDWTGSSVIYSFSVTTLSTLNKLTLFQMTDWQVAGASRVQLRQKNSSTYLWQYSFTANGDLTWQPNITLSPGNYEVVVSTDYSYWYDSDDISWDDVVVSLQPVAVDPACAALFPYPIQGRNSSGYIDFGGGYNSGPAGLVYGTNGGKIGYSSIRNVNTVNTTNGNCDGLVCVFDAYAKSLALNTNPFPTSGTKSVTVDYSYPNYTRTLTSADGSAFGDVTLYSDTYLNITNPGITIKNLTLNSGVTTVYLAAGEYWIDNLSIASGAQIVLNGEVRLHVKTLTMQSSSYLNSPKGVYTPTAYQGGDPSKLLLIMYGPLTLGNNAIISGMIYRTDYNAGGTDINMASSSYIFGRVNANSIAMTWGSTIYGANQQCPSLPATTSVNHYEIRYPASQITCEPATITINACTNSDTSSCTKDTTASSSVTLASPTSGWSSNPVTLTNGSATVTLSHYAVGSVTLGLSGSSAYTCFKNGVVDSSCQLPFVSSAFSFDIPTFYAGSNSGNVTLKALQASGSNPAVCTSLFVNQTQNINFSSQYVLPATGTLLPSLNGTPISSNTSVPLTFNSAGTASLNLAYNDAGVLGITAQYTKTDAAAGSLSISGSDNVAVLPAKILLTAADQTACSGNSDATYANCAKYKTVGANFVLNAEAGYTSGGSWHKTANFTYSASGMNILPEVQHQLMAPAPPPAGTGVLPALASTSLTFSGGVASATLSESDVGVYEYGVSAFVPYAAYQNESPQLTVPLSWSDPVGRFIPSRLQAAALSQGTLSTDTCSNNAVNAALGYTGQSLRFATAPMLSVTALGSDGTTVLKNYQGAFAKITGTNAADSGNFVAVLGPKSSVNTLTSTATWQAGSWSTLSSPYNLLYSFGNDAFIFNKTSSNAVVPFETALAVTTLTDSDGVTTTGLPLNLFPVAPDGSAFKVYSGRLLLENANGAENSALTLPFYMQYWNGSAYVLNSADNCSVLASDALLMNSASSWSGIPLRTSSISSSSATTNATLSPGQISGGMGNILFSAPNATGWVDISGSASLPRWMQDLSQTSGLNPARASFGYYRGNDRLIYRREVFGQ